MKNYWKKVTTLLTTLTLVVVLGVCLAACGGSSELTVSDYKTRLENAGYAVDGGEAGILDTQDEIKAYLEGDDGAELTQSLNLKAEDIEWMFMASKENDNAFISIVKLTSKDKASEVLEKAQAMFEAVPSLKDVIKTAQDGKVAMLGDQASINAALGK